MSAPSSPAQRDRALARAEQLTRWMDELFRIPFTRIRVGLDAMIGLVPGLGDIAGLLIGSWTIVEAHRAGAPMALKLRMARNTLLDAVLGFVPIVGDLFDLAYRSNRRNLDLLLLHLRPATAHARPGPWPLRLGVLAGLMLLGWGTQRAGLW